MGPDEGGAEFHPAGVDFERLAYLVVGFVGGGLFGIIVGAIASVLLLRRGKPKSEA